MGYRFQDFAPVAITLLIIGVTLPISADIMRELQYSSDAVTHTNESHAFTNITCLQLDHRPLGSVSVVSNETEIIGTTNTTEATWSLCNRDHSSIMITFNDTEDCCTAGTWNVTYSSYDTATGRVAGNVSLGLEELGSWQDTIALVIAAAVVLGLIFFAFSRFGGAGGGAV